MSKADENQIRIEFAKELDKATILIVDGVLENGEKVLRFFNASDFQADLKVNDVGTDIEVNKRIFFSGKHVCELVFYHDESINAVIHRCEALKMCSEVEYE